MTFHLKCVRTWALVVSVPLHTFVLFYCDEIVVKKMTAMGI